MNFKKLLMLLKGMVLVVPTTLSIIACDKPTHLKDIASVIRKKI